MEKLMNKKNKKQKTSKPISEEVDVVEGEAKASS